MRGGLGGPPAMHRGIQQITVPEAFSLAHGSIGQMSVFFRPLAVLFVFTGLATAASDTIVLKNGRRVVAENVTEEETRVVYETPQGKFSLAKSLVDHVDPDGALPPAKPPHSPPSPIPP